MTKDYLKALPIAIFFFIISFLVHSLAGDYHREGAFVLFFIVLPILAITSFIVPFFLRRYWKLTVGVMVIETLLGGLINNMAPGFLLEAIAIPLVCPKIIYIGMAKPSEAAEDEHVPYTV